MKKIRVIIVDDERPAREELKSALKKHNDFHIVDEAKNADEAREKIEAQTPDLIFLDIQMPEKSGFDLLESLNHVPEVVFTTAFDRYAVQAFEVSALDYLLKPVREERFAKAIEKIRTKLAEKTLPGDRQIFIKDGDKCYFVRLHDIYLIESMDNYSCLFFNGKKVAIKRSLNRWETLLHETDFFRINRHQIINTGYIHEVKTFPGGRLGIVLKTGETLEVSGRQSVKFKNMRAI